MRILDLFCGEGGAAAGYIRAGHDVTGVDLKASAGKYYPGTFIQGDALEYLAREGRSFDFIHASPPCQGYSRGNAGRVTNWPLLISDVRALAQETETPYVIENVADAAWDMQDPTELCGCMFGLTAVDDDGILLHLQRVRLFETSFPLTAPRAHDHSNHEWVAGAYGGARRDKYEAKYIRKGGYVPPNKEVVKALLGIEHDMTWNGLFESIPPVYTEYIIEEFRRQPY